MSFYPQNSFVRFRAVTENINVMQNDELNQGVKTFATGENEPKFSIFHFSFYTLNAPSQSLFNKKSMLAEFLIFLSISLVYVKETNQRKPFCITKVIQNKRV